MPKFATSLAILMYYIRFAILTLVAYICNKSFLVYHPSRLFPTTIAPSRNQTIHSFYPTNEMINHISIRSQLPPSHRRWFNPQDLVHFIYHLHYPLRPITLEGKLSGPALRQGMVVIKRNHDIYLREEHGRWYSRNNLIVTTAFSLTQGFAFKLFIPIHFFDRCDLFDESPTSLFDNPVRLAFSTTDSCLVKHLLP